MSDIVDDIDALVDWQLEQESSGYDHNINQERCRCGRDWHGLPITKRIDSMRSRGQFDPSYVYADDESPIMCVGSNMPGPWRQVGMWQLPDRETFHELVTRLGVAQGLPGRVTVRLWNGDLTESRDVDIEAFSTNPPTRIEWRNPEPLPWPTGFPSTEMRRVGEQFSAIRDALADEPDTRTPQQRALPRPSTTPPMWANDPTRSRRPRRKKNQPTRQGIA